MEAHASQPQAGSPEAASDEQRFRRRQAAFTENFSQAVAILMRAPGYMSLPIAALEWLLLPPLLVGQCAIARGPAGRGGVVQPLALALWARVSPNVDARLSATLDKPLNLQPGDWSSGSIPWVLAVAGSQAAMPTFLEQLSLNTFKGESVKVRLAGQSGKTHVRLLTDLVADHAINRKVNSQN